MATTALGRVIGRKSICSASLPASAPSALRHIDEADQIASAWQHALSADRPAVIDAHVDPTVAQLPPHISFEEAHNYFSAMSKGDPQEVSVIKEAIKSLVAGAFPHRKD